jgi:hypothetical protein
MKNRIILVFGILLVLSFLGAVYAEKLDIQIENNYIPGEDVNFKLILYDDENNKIDGQISYIIQNYYSEIIKEGATSSGDEVVFKLPEDAIQGPWKISASYNNVEVNRLFNVGELEKAEIKLEGDILIIRNIGNTPYDKRILIYIGNNDQTAQVFLEVGQTKEIRLTAPDGKYDIKVIEGNDEKTLEFKEVSLTGNAIGLESVFGEQGFWKKYPAVSLFLVVLLLVVIVIVGLKAYKKYSK